MSNEPNPISIRMAKEFPQLWEMAKQYDFAERLRGCSSELHEEADRALREIFDARNFDPGASGEGVGA